MKKNTIIGMALALGILSFGALSASAADTCGKCADNQSIQQFRQETDSLESTLKSKDLELHSMYLTDTYDTRKASDLEAEIKELKAQINASAAKHKIPPCSRS